MFLQSLARSVFTRCLPSLTMCSTGVCKGGDILQTESDMNSLLLKIRFNYLPLLLYNIFILHHLVVCYLAEIS